MDYDRCRFTIGYKGIPQSVKPSEIFELTKHLDGKSCYTYKSVAYIGFNNEKTMNAALQIPITYNGITLSALHTSEKQNLIKF